MEDKPPPPPFTPLEKAAFWIMATGMAILAVTVILKQAEMIK